MRIRELLSSQSIALGAESANKKDIIEKMTVLMEASGNLKNRRQYLEGVLEREAEGTTGIGEGIAIPHAKNTAVKEAFRDQLIEAENKEQFLAVIDKKEHELDEKASEKEKVNTAYKVLAITACPTGIAHTFMAAENLEKKGKELGIPVKVETQGADGAKNVLTAEEIKAADGIIIAADKNVDLARFDGKKVLITKVADGIHKPEELIQKIESGNVPVYHHGGQGAEEQDEVKESLGRKIYKDLMNGVSHMLPFVIGGGILIAIAFLLDDYSIDPSNFGKNTPVAAYFKTIGEFAFGMMLPVLSGFIAMSIADRPGLAVGFVAGLVAKAGCTFANPAGGDVNAGFLGALFAGFAAGYVVLALKKLTSKIPQSLNSVRPMIIYPVAGILLGAVVTTLINPFMGMINDALTGALNSMNGTSRVLLGTIVGSAVAGGLSMFFECTLRAPHGGVFVLPTIGHPLMYALSILIGSLIGCVILGILKKPLEGEK